MSKFTIVRDTREKEAYGWYYPEDAYCAGTIVRKVDAGDYTVDGLDDFICIERKRNIDEFAGNCVEKRWNKCVERMAECKHAYLIFEFSMKDVDNYPLSSKAPAFVKKRLGRVKPKFIRKVIYEARDKGIHVLFCKDAMTAENVAYRLLRKAHRLHDRNTRES